ncbi:MAG: hypothetical protein KC646_00450 [Candidatus Cloacimonetes bacterium]|nr:hypothetical protein [Candidatus Cloacimonadota bacterium]
MKILSINFSNLNSLKGDFCIQLDSGSLHDAGIFAICGPTGSGKSTILDAITLALFGKAARYDDGTNVQNMMSRGTWESKASVSFETRKKIYTSTWMLKRAHKKPDGKFQGVKREVSDASGTILFTKKNDIDDFIASESGLDYKRFLRSVLLAQGQFKEFLDANAKARGELLEKITGTEIYSELGKLCFILTKEKNIEIGKLKQHVDHLKLLVDEQIDDLNTEKKSLNDQIKESKTQIESLNKSQNKYKILDTYHQNEGLIKQKIIDLKPLLDNQETTIKKLNKHKQTQDFQQSLFNLNSIQEQLTDCQNNTVKIDAQLPKAQTLLNDLTQSLKSFYNKEISQLKQKFEKNKLAIDQTNKSLLKSKDWLSENEALSQVLAQYPKIKLAHSHFLETKTKVKFQESTLTSQKDKLNNLDKQSQQLEKEYLKQAESHDLVQKTVRDLESKYEKLIQVKTLIEYQQDLKEQHSHQSNVQSLLSNVKVHDGLKLRQTEIQNKIDQQIKLKDKLSIDLQDINSSYEKENKVLEDKQKILNLSLTIDSLTQQRSQLNDDQECPLCGSLDHPYTDGLEISLNQSQIDFEEQNVAVKKISKEKTKLETELQLTAKNLDLEQKELKAVSSQLQDHRTIIKPLLKSLSFNLMDLDDNSFVLRLNHKTETIKSTIDELETKIKKIVSQKSVLDQHKQQLDQSNKVLTEKQAIKSQNEKLNKDLKETIKSSQANLDLLTKNLQKDSNDIVEQLEKLNYTCQLDKIDSLIETLDSEIQVLQRHEKDIQSFDSELQLKNKDQSFIQEQVNTTTGKMNNIDTIDQDFNFVTEPNELIYEKRIQDGKQHLKILQEKQQELKGQKLDLDATLQKLVTKLDKDIKSSIFTNIEDLKQSALSTSQQNELQEILDDIKSKSSSIDTLKNQNIKLYEDHELKAIDHDDSPTALQALNDQRKQIEQQIELLNQRLGQISNIFTEDLNKQNQVKSILLEIQALKEKYKDWFMMNSLIGSAEGDSFSKFAQGLTLQRLVSIANQHLFELNPRYQIQRSSDKELELEIVDLYQANSVRPTKSLSGGESFLLSLSLALSLSELSSQKNPIRSLFIDEGFGSLDSDTLDVALSALENLRHQNRMIGIISHVDALKQRIHAKVEVNRQSNGNSSISIS